MTARVGRRFAAGAASAILTLISWTFSFAVAFAFALAATATTTATVSLAWQGQALQFAEVHAREANRGFEVFAKRLRLGGFAFCGGLFGEQFVGLPRGFDFRL